MLFLRDAGERRGVTAQEEGQIGTGDDTGGDTTGDQRNGQQQGGQQQDGLQYQVQQQDRQRQDGRTFGQQQQAGIDSVELNITRVTVSGGGQVSAEGDLGGTNQTDQNTTTQIGQTTDPLTPETDNGTFGQNNDTFGQDTGTNDTGAQQGENGVDLLDDETQVTLHGGDDEEFVVQSGVAADTYNNISIQVSEIRVETEEGCELLFATDGLEINIEGSFQVANDTTTQVLAEIDVTQAILESRAIAENCPSEEDTGLVDEVTPQEEQRVSDADLEIETVQVLVATDVSLFHESTNTFDEEEAERQDETGAAGQASGQTGRQDQRNTRDDQNVTP